MEIRWSIRLARHRGPTVLTNGAKSAISGKTNRFQRATSPRASWERAISMSMEAGGTLLNMETSGFLMTLGRDGRLIVRDTGYGNPRGDGLGWTMLRGDSHHFTMAAG